MKKLKNFLVVLMAAALLLCVVPVAAFAEEDPTPTATPEPALMRAISCNIGEGYAVRDAEGNVTDNFVPTDSVSKDKSGLTLRVYYTGDLIPAEGDAVSVSDGFIGQNSYVAYCDTAARFVDIVGLKFNGITAHITVKWNDRVVVSEMISEAKVASSETGSGNGGTDEKNAPSLIIRSSSIGKESINAGETFKLSLTIYATTSGTKNAEDVVVNVRPGEGIAVASGSSSTYVGTMAPGASKTVTFPMKALDSFTGNVTTIAVGVSGSGAGSETTVSVPIVQPDRFELTRVECPEILTAGEENTISVVFVNKGKNAVNNVTVEMNAQNIASPMQSEYVGNLPAGTENSVDFDVEALEAGVVSGVITVTYEDSNGNTVVKNQEFSTQADAAMSWEDYNPGDSGDDWGEEMPSDMEPEKTGLPVWAYAVIAVAVVAAVVGVVVVLKKRKAKKALAEAEDEDI